LNPEILSPQKRVSQKRCATRALKTGGEKNRPSTKRAFGEFPSFIAQNLILIPAQILDKALLKRFEPPPLIKGNPLCLWLNLAQRRNNCPPQAILKTRSVLKGPSLGDPNSGKVKLSKKLIRSRRNC